MQIIKEKKQKTNKQTGKETTKILKFSTLKQLGCEKNVESNLLGFQTWKPRF